MIRIYEGQEVARLEMVADTQACEVSKTPVCARQYGIVGGSFLEKISHVKEIQNQVFLPVSKSDAERMLVGIRISRVEGSCGSGGLNISVPSPQVVVFLYREFSPHLYDPCVSIAEID